MSVDYFEEIGRRAQSFWRSTTGQEPQEGREAGGPMYTPEFIKFLRENAEDPEFLDFLTWDLKDEDEDEGEDEGEDLEKVQAQINLIVGGGRDDAA
jgi:hypothetical protein